MRISQRVYDLALVAGFQKTRAKYGGLSNMATGYPMVVNDLHFDSSEALYQACRFPHQADLQRHISSISSPMAAKMEAHKNVGQTRRDWQSINIQAMRWCLKIKLSQNLLRFGAVIDETGDLPIVEISRKDNFWGAIPQPDGSLRGCNVLGRLEMELRQGWHEGGDDIFKAVQPPVIPNFWIAGSPVGILEITAAAHQEPRQFDMDL